MPVPTVARVCGWLQATVYRYLHEAVEVIPAQVQDLPALYPVAVRGLPVLADTGYTGADIGVHVLTRGAVLYPGTRARNLLLTVLRAPAERAHALLESRFKTLRRITICPWRIGHVVAAAVVILTMHRGRW